MCGSVANPRRVVKDVGDKLLALEWQYKNSSYLPFTYQCLCVNKVVYLSAIYRLRWYHSKNKSSRATSSGGYAIGESPFALLAYRFPASRDPYVTYGGAAVQIAGQNPSEFLIDIAG